MTISTGDFRGYMRILAGWVWSQQVEAFRFNLVLQEETITETLLLRMARELTPFGFRVKMFNRTEEGGLKREGKVIREGHGADWEWFYESPVCMVRFRIQAKRLYWSPSTPGRYGGFIPRGTQIDNLIDKAEQVQANPIYVFYNHPEVSDSHYFKQSSQPDYFGRSCWGCSVATASFMKSAIDANLSTLESGQVPWHRFFGIGKFCLSERMMKHMAGGQKFIRATERPEWVDTLLNEQEGPYSRLNEELDERDLAGVAYIGYGRGDFED